MLQSLSSKDCPTSLRHGNRHSFGRRCNARQLEHDPVASFCIRLDLLCGGGGSFECRLLTQCRTSRSDLPAFFAKLDMIWCAGVSNKCTTTATSCYIILHPRHEHVPICANMCQYVPICANMCQYVPICANMCQYVPICAMFHRTCRRSFSRPLPLLPLDGNMSGHVLGHLGRCRLRRALKP